MNIAIVVIAYNRHLSLGRLLNSIEKSEFDSKADLIISIEGNATKEVCTEAESFRSKKLNKILINRKEKLGLRKHVIACGDLVNDYDGIIILEDDLLVDKYFYLYAVESLSFYKDSKSIAGIALYSHEYNEYANLPFRAMHNGFVTYPVQIPCSSGQCWTRDQWQGFKNWYNGKSADYLNQLEGLPDQVKAWPESSWKKYFHGYIVEHDLYFMYPYISYSTNCSDAGGTHIASEIILHQVCLPAQKRPRPNLSFCPSDYTEVKYDAFFEPIGDCVYRCLSMLPCKVAIDTQMLKPANLMKNYEYALTARDAEEVFKCYKLSFRPVELNLKYEIQDKTMQGQLVLAESKKVIFKKRFNISYFAYYACMDVLTKNFIFAFIKGVLAKAFKKLRIFS